MARRPRVWSRVSDAQGGRHSRMFGMSLASIDLAASPSLELPPHAIIAK